MEGTNITAHVGEGNRDDEEAIRIARANKGDIGGCPRGTFY